MSFKPNYTEVTFLPFFDYSSSFLIHSCTEITLKPLKYNKRGDKASDIHHFFAQNHFETYR